MTRDEERLLLYLETCLVDNMGHVDPRRINAADVATIVRWMGFGFVDFVALPKDQQRPDRSHRVVFCDAAWEQAANARRRRAERYTLTWSQDVLAQLGHHLDSFHVGDQVPA